MATFCKSCGGNLNRAGNYYICEYCGNKWEIDRADDVHAVDRANAWSALRDNDFEKAAELFESIISKEAENHEAYWGRALATGGITYVTDLMENKKVPTCNNITETPFLQSRDVQKAISFAPADIGNNYEQQAIYIDKVRTEWLEKASKEPEYDIFISFKDSNRENGIERTQDSIDAQDLYNALVAEGYKVFFSRISLRDKISEQYEPYIYNAIKTAKVMIVFGEKAEYINSAWVKNEWSRFKARIQKGEKHKNSLIVVYKNMNPGDLPIVLKSRQCMNAADMTFLSGLLRHIKRVVEESRKNVHLEKIEVESSQISKKATTLSVKAVQTHDVGIGAIAETSISEKQSISLIHSYLEEHQWQEAANLVEDVLFENPSCAEAIWAQLLVSFKAESNDALVKKLVNFATLDYASIEKVLNCASVQFAEEILLLLYDSAKLIPSETYEKVLATILPFAFSKRQQKINEAFDAVIQRSMYAPFTLLLNTLKSTEVDQYIDYNYRYAMNAKSLSEKISCLNNILNVDEGNPDALREMVDSALRSRKHPGELTGHFEALLKFTPSADDAVIYFLKWLIADLDHEHHCEFAKQLIRYYTKDISGLKDLLISLSYRIISQSLFEKAEYFLNLVLSFDANNADVYWAICLMKVGASTEANILKQDTFLVDVPEFNKYLTLVDANRRKECILMSKEQARKKLNRIEKRLDEENHLLQNIQQIKKLNGKLKLWLILLIACGISGIVALAVLSVGSFSGGNILPVMIYIVISFICGCIANGNPYDNAGNGAAGCLYFVIAYIITPIYAFVGWIFLLIRMSKVYEERSALCADCGLQTSDNIDKGYQKQAELIRQLEEDLENLRNYVKSFK